MAKSLDIIRQLQTVLPRFTDKFSDTLTIKALTNNSTKGKWQTVNILVNLVNLVGVTDGSLTVTVDGRSHDLKHIDLSFTTTLAQIATVLTGLLTDCVVTSTINTLLFTSNSNGSLSTVVVSSGTDVVDLASVTFLNTATGIETDGVDASIITVQTNTPHGMVTNNMVKIFDTYTKNLIDSWSINSDGNLVIVLHEEHDKTLAYPTTLTAKLYFSNIAKVDYKILDIIDNYTLVLNTAINPVGTGYLLENRMDGYNGFKQITVPVLSLDTFTYIHQGLSQPADIATGGVIGNYRIAGVSDISRVFGHYEKQSSDSKLWAWIIMDKCKGSFTRESQTDATARFTKLEDFQQELYQSFHVIVAVPTEHFTGAVEAVDAMQDVRTYLFKTLCGVMFSSGFTKDTRYMCSYVEDSFYDYAGGYYLHDFVFENITLVDQNDICDEDDTRAFRHAEVDNAMQFDNYVDPSRKNAITDL